MNTGEDSTAFLALWISAKYKKPYPFWPTINFPERSAIYYKIIILYFIKGRWWLTSSCFLMTTSTKRPNFEHSLSNISSVTRLSPWKFCSSASSVWIDSYKTWIWNFFGCTCSADEFFWCGSQNSNLHKISTDKAPSISPDHNKTFCYLLHDSPHEFVVVEASNQCRSSFSIFAISEGM